MDIIELLDKETLKLVNKSILILLKISFRNITLIEIII